MPPLRSQLRSEPEEMNVASGVVSMGRSGMAGNIAAAEGRMPALVRKLPLMLGIILRSTYGRSSDRTVQECVSAGTSFASFVNFCSNSSLRFLL